MRIHLYIIYDCKALQQSCIAERVAEILWHATPKILSGPSKKKCAHLKKVCCSKGYKAVFRNPVHSIPNIYVTQVTVVYEVKAERSDKSLENKIMTF